MPLAPAVLRLESEAQLRAAWLCRAPMAARSLGKAFVAVSLSVTLASVAVGSSGCRSIPARRYRRHTAGSRSKSRDWGGNRASCLADAVDFASSWNFYIPKSVRVRDLFGVRG